MKKRNFCELLYMVPIFLRNTTIYSVGSIAQYLLYSIRHKKSMGNFTDNSPGFLLIIEIDMILPVRAEQNGRGTLCRAGIFYFLHNFFADSRISLSSGR